jgi:hypothetical protein
MTPKEDAKFLFDYAKNKYYFNYKDAKKFSYLYVENKLCILKDKRRIKHWEKVKIEINNI